MEKPPPPMQRETEEDLTPQRAYNIVTDTVMGPNVRLRDNLIQGLAVLVCGIIGAVVGLFIIEEPLGGLLVGALIGVVAGLFGSGIFLMIYRAVRHAQGKHD